MSRRINISSKFFHCRVAKPFHFFRTKWNGNIPTGTPLTGASNAGGVGRNCNSEPISSFTVCCQCCDRPGVINTVPQVVTFVAGSKRQSSLMTGDDDEMFMRRSLNVTPKTTEEH